jgi:hypothetical protein
MIRMGPIEFIAMHIELVAVVPFAIVEVHLLILGCHDHCHFPLFL